MEINRKYTSYILDVHIYLYYLAFQRYHLSAQIRKACLRFKFLYLDRPANPPELQEAPAYSMQRSLADRRFYCSV